jgi:hypothetical protein
MLKSILNIIGWIAIISAGFNGAIRLFADDQAVRRLAGSSRDLDIVLTVLVVGLIFIALAAIIGRLDKLLTRFENGDD